jgi:hypothetical protein
MGQGSSARVSQQVSKNMSPSPIVPTMLQTTYKLHKATEDSCVMQALMREVALT